MDTEFVDLGEFETLSNGGRRVVEVGGVSILCVHINSEFAAVINSCTHLNQPLDKGRLIGHQLSCPWHGACFDLRTGRALSGPAVVPLKVLKIKIEGGRIWALVPRA
jgi:3-phenylpropionate/trans-cinnamate dioxygenase ferredoxin subunit